MRNGAAHKPGLDRRILKAFYTQYVAVLLIVLVFSIASFQRAVSGPSTSPVATSASINPVIGSLRLSPLFDQNGEFAGAHAELVAVATLLREHDVRAVFTIARGSEPGEVYDDLLQRVSAVERLLEDLRVAPSSFRFVVASPNVDERGIRVDFEEVARDKLNL
jgi:hypothetical protein